MKKVLDSVKNVVGDTTAKPGEDYSAAIEMHNEILQLFYAVKNLTRKKGTAGQ